MNIEDGWGGVQEPIDWSTYLRGLVDETSELPLFGVDLRYSDPPDWSVLATVGEKLEGTPAHARFTDAALGLIESGTPMELRVGLFAPYERAPRARERMLRLLKEERKRVADNRIAAELLGSLLRPNPADREALDLLFAAVTEEPNERLVELAARYAPDWLMEHLPPPTANRSLSACIVYAPPERRAAMCAAIAASGSEHVRSLIGLLIDPDASPWVQRASEAVAQDPILGRALDEARSKAPARAPGRRPK